MCACMCLCVQNPVFTYVCIGCAQMHEDIWEIHKEMFTVLPPGVILRVKEEELEFYISYCTSYCMV